jgi:NhaA family Na+:H+ antiporter
MLPAAGFQRREVGLSFPIPVLSNVRVLSLHGDSRLFGWSGRQPGETIRAMPSVHPPKSVAPDAPAERVARRLVRPLERFLRIEASSSILLLLATAAALVWANSPWSASYEALWHTPIVVGAGPFVVNHTVHFWINDGLMVIFFLVAGLEIRRELYAGELAGWRRAALPVAAALGGMIVPAIIYLTINRSAGVLRGWGVPTATDIAFAVGILAILGKRVPAPLRVLLLALAVIDDLGAIVVITIFYSGSIGVGGLLLVAAGLLGVVLLRSVGVRRAVVYALPGSVIWWGTLRAGIHPTMAGVVLGLMTPVRSRFDREGFVSAAMGAVAELAEHVDQKFHEAHRIREPLRRMRHAHREALPPTVRIQAALHPWVAYFIVPVFALANAGVDLRAVTFTGNHAAPVMLGIFLGLLVGKPLGVLAGCFVAVKLRVAALPSAITWTGVLLAGTVAGVGFTMAIFIAALAFPDGAMLAQAKLAILASSAGAAVAGMLLGRAVLRQPRDVGDWVRVRWWRPRRGSS